VEKMSVDRKLQEAAEKFLADYMKKVQGYFETIIRSAKIAKNVEGYQGLPPEHVKVNVQLPVKDQFVPIPFEFDTVLGCMIKLTGLSISEVYVNVMIPGILLGPKNIMPQLVFTIKAPVMYPGNIGLVWEPLSGNPNKYGFHPFGGPQTMRDDLTNYFKEGVVDQFCDILNRFEYAECQKLRAFANEMSRGKMQEHFKRFIDKKTPPALILVPIVVEHDPEQKETMITCRSWAGQNQWISAGEVIMEVFEPLASIISMFNESGELVADNPIKKTLEVIEHIETADRRTIDKREKMKDAKVSDEELFGGPKKTVERDEFGFIKDEKLGFASSDTTAARNAILERQKALQQSVAAQSSSAGQKDLSHVKKFKTAEEWFNIYQGKRFTVKGEVSGLPFIDKANVELVKQCSPPFILKYARDQIRLKRNCTGIKAAEILFAVYNLGFLYEV
jgi:hypothetical protein